MIDGIVWYDFITLLFVCLFVVCFSVFNDLLESTLVENMSQNPSNWLFKSNQITFIVTSPQPW